MRWRGGLGPPSRIAFAQPESDLAATIDAEYGNYDFRKIRASTNVPLISKSFLSRFTLTATERAGTITNRFDGHHINDLDNLGGRAQLRLLPSDILDISLSGDYSRDDTHRGTFGLFDDVLDQHVNAFQPAHEKRDVYGVAARAVYTLPEVTLISITGFRGVKARADASDFVPVHNLHLAYNSQQQQVSQEVRFLSPTTRRLRWVGGALYYREWTRDLGSYELPLGLANVGLPPGYRETSHANAGDDSYSLFADVTYSLLEKLDVSAGVRFSYDERDLDYRHINTLGLPGVFAPAQQAKRRATFRNWSPRFVASYHWSTQLLTYASISRGYKAGSFNTLLVGNTQFTFAAESAWNYEVGLKYTLFEERVAVNVAAFYFDWHDPQVAVSNGFYFTTSNASRARSFGGDWELLARPFRGLEVSVSGGYADATFVRFRNFVPGKDADGHRMPYTSTMSANAAVQYRFPLTSWANLMMRWDVVYKSSLFYDVANTLREPGYVLVNVRLGLEAERWDLFGFVRNTLDERYRTMGIISPTQGPIGIPGDPGTYGMQVRLRF